MISRRCTNHKDVKDIPQLCHVCQRLDVEAKIARKTIDVLLEAGYSLSVDNGDGDEVAPESQTALEVSKLMGETDEDYLIASKDGKKSWVFFVYGNSGWDVISDYTTDLEAVLEPVSQYAETFE
jgi:hypothetical protein